MVHVRFSYNARATDKAIRPSDTVVGMLHQERAERQSNEGAATDS